MSEKTMRTIMNGKPVFTVPAKTVINFDSGFKHKLLCDGPTFSTGTACAYSCSFCYVPSQMKKQELWLREHGMAGAFEDVVIRRENALETMRGQLLTHKGREIGGQKLVCYASPLVDVAANMELVKETVEACAIILSHTNWDIRLLSKSNLLPRVAEGLEIKAPLGLWDGPLGWMSRVIYGVSTGTLENGLAKAFEAGTALVSKRIESLHWLQDRGYRTFGMICPSLPQRSYMTFAAEMTEAIRWQKCEHVWAEVMNLRGDSFGRTIKALRGAGFTWEAQALITVSENKDSWEDYARDTFTALTHFVPPEKLRFMQYIGAGTRPWWESQRGIGAILL